LPSEQKQNRTFLYAGSLGYAIAFIVWAQWLLLVAYGYISTSLGLINSDFPGGIYILYLPYHYAIAVLLPLCFGFTSLGWFGLCRNYRSRSALIAAILSAVILGLFVYSAIRILIFLDPSQYLFRPIIIFVGIIFWGDAILDIRTHFKHPRLEYGAGLALMIAGAIGISFLLPSVLYFGLEYWFAAMGWLYAFATLATAYSFFQLARDQGSQQSKQFQK
jgi:hypothetical protein